MTTMDGGDRRSIPVPVGARYDRYRSAVFSAFGLVCDVVRYGGELAGEPARLPVSSVGSPAVDIPAAQYVLEMDLGSGLVLYAFDHDVFGLSQAVSPAPPSKWLWHTTVWRCTRSGVAVVPVPNDDPAAVPTHKVREVRISDGHHSLIATWRSLDAGGNGHCARSDIDGLLIAVRASMCLPTVAAAVTIPMKNVAEREAANSWTCAVWRKTLQSLFAIPQLPPGWGWDTPNVDVYIANRTNAIERIVDDFASKIAGEVIDVVADAARAYVAACRAEISALRDGTYSRSDRAASDAARVELNRLAQWL